MRSKFRAPQWKNGTKERKGFLTKMLWRKDGRAWIMGRNYGIVD